MSELFPPFQWESVLLHPWTQDTSLTFWTFLMGFLVTGACGLVGNFLLLRRMVFIGDAISHTILPGLVVTFLLLKSSGVWAMFAGAVLTGMLTVALIEFIHRQSRIKPDAAICITFTSLFAIGVIMISSLESRGAFHIDPDCVLYGEIAFVPHEPFVTWRGVELAPPSVVRMGTVLLAVLAAIFLFYKELLITSFDAALARSLGMRVQGWHYGLMAVLSIVIVSAFEAVGAILAVAMLMVPPMAAAQISERLPARLAWTLVHAFLSALIGVHLSIWLNCSAAGAMVVAAAGLFVLVWAGSLAAKKWTTGANHLPVGP